MQVLSPSEASNLSQHRIQESPHANKELMFDRSNNNRKYNTEESVQQVASSSAIRTGSDEIQANRLVNKIGELVGSQP